MDRKKLTAEKMRDAVESAKQTVSAVRLTERGSRLDVCRIWDNVFLWSNHIRDDFLPYQQDNGTFYVTVNCCTEGRCEVRLKNGTYLYMDPGLFCINTTEPKEGYVYPNGYYEGLELALDLSEGTGIPCALQDYGITKEKILGCLDGQRGVLLGRMNEWETQKVLMIQDQLETGDLPTEQMRFHVLELLVSLTADRNADTGGRYVTQGQRRIARSARDEMVRDLSQRHTVEDLAEKAGVSASALKKYFSSVYGKPVSVFLRDLRIAKARELLSGTRQSIGQIAQQCGYASQSKFTAAFRGVMDMTPLEYRRLHYEGAKKDAAE